MKIPLAFLNTREAIEYHCGKLVCQVFYFVGTEKNIL